MAELVAISSVWPSGAAFATAFTPTCWPAPGRFSTTNGLPIRCSQTCAAMRASRSVEPAGVNGTTTVTVLDGQSCADAEMIANNHISAAPVVDEKGELVGIVSEGDLLRRPEIGTTRRHSWWLELISTGWSQ